MRTGATTREAPAPLDGERVSGALSTYHSDQLEGLPAVVQRYFRTVLVEGQSLVSAVDLDQTGSFNRSGECARWKPFTASQRVLTRPPCFAWDARIRLLPGLAVRVRDTYSGGEGRLQVKLLGLVPLVNSGGTPAMARGELLRFLAEAAWYPTALLPGQGVRWMAEDEGSARALLADGDAEVALLFRFGADGLVESVYSEARGRAQGKTTVPTPWEGRWSSYARRDGMQVPLEGEAAWLMPDGPLPYWRGRLERICYEFMC